MDTSATLTAKEAVAWSDPERPLPEAHGCYNAVTSTGVENRDICVAFDEAFRLKKMLDSLEDSLVNEPLWELLSIVLNCEYRIYVLYEFIPLRQCPFLSHWVETAQRLREQLRKCKEDEPVLHQKGPTSKGVLHARLGLITRLLQGNGGQDKELLNATPRTLCTPKTVMDLDLRPFVRMLQEEGIYDADGYASETETEKEQDHTEAPVNMTNGNSNGTTSGTPKPRDQAPWETEILTLLHTDQQQAIHYLKHLPIEIPSLNFLTNLITDRALSSLDIDPSPIIRDFLQRSLRIVELMTEPPPANDPLYSDDNNPNGNGHPSEVPNDYGKQAQERAVNLLVLFMKNLIKEELVPVNDMFFEIQEICVRYIFMKDVRDFKNFVEGRGLGNMDVGR